MWCYAKHMNVLCMCCMWYLIVLSPFEWEELQIENVKNHDRLKNLDRIKNHTGIPVPFTSFFWFTLCQLFSGYFAFLISTTTHSQYYNFINTYHHTLILYINGITIMHWSRKYTISLPVCCFSLSSTPLCEIQREFSTSPSLPPTFLPSSPIMVKSMET